jgi:hypothetical protein
LTSTTLVGRVDSRGTWEMVVRRRTQVMSNSCIKIHPKMRTDVGSIWMISTRGWVSRRRTRLQVAERAHLLVNPLLDPSIDGTNTNTGVWGIFKGLTPVLDIRLAAESTLVASLRSTIVFDTQMTVGAKHSGWRQCWWWTSHQCRSCLFQSQIEKKRNQLFSIAILFNRAVEVLINSN